MTPVKHPSATTVSWALMQTARLHRFYVGEMVSEIGLFAGQEQVLLSLVTAPSMTMGELATMLKVRPPTASKTIARLALLGLVERSTAPDDARIVRIGLTPAGEAKAEYVAAVLRRVENDLLDGLDSKDRRRLRKFLRHASLNLAKALGGDERDFDIPVDALGE
jgi:DNA-binding MarR family transcriptional regulator